MINKDKFSNTKIYRAKILDIKDEFKNVKTYILEKPKGLNFDEGSSFRLAIPGFNHLAKANNKLVHNLSINSLDTDDFISFTTKFSIRKSDFKKELLKKDIGDYLEFFDIESNMTLRREDKPIVLISMGIGLTTMKPLIETFLKDPSNISYLTSIGIAREDFHLFDKEIEKIKASKFSHTWVNGRSSFFELINEMNFKSCIIYLVGSNEFILDSIVRLRKLGVDDSAITIDMSDKKKELMFLAANKHEIF